MKNKLPSFKVITCNQNTCDVEYYDVMPFFEREWQAMKKRKGKLPETYEEFKDFIRDNSLFQYWSRCEYEVIVSDWPCQTKETKIDVHQQILSNIDIITKIFMEYKQKNNSHESI